MGASDGKNPAANKPRHVAVIMDGNGRWAQKRGLPRSFGHKAGVDALREVIRFADREGIEALTIYAFSTENWKRSAEEVGALMGLLLEYFRRELSELKKENVRIRILGDIEGMPEAFAKQKAALRNAMEQTETNTGLRLNIALNYGGRQEIVSACRRIAERVEKGEIAPRDVTEELFASNLYTAGLPEVDLLIRTSGEMRISNFLLWQLAYSEIYITDVLWPDFNAAEFGKALSAYAGRDRRFGGVKKG